MKITEIINEAWSQKYKRSINCSHPKGFSQKAHCAGKKKHNESIEMEMTCPDCGMCESHGNLNEIKKSAKDANGFTRCWPGKHAVGTKKGKNGGQVRNCVPNESMSETTGDKPFDTMMKTIKKGTGKQATADRKEQKQQNKEKTQQAIDSMFGSGNPADKLSIRKQGVAEGLDELSRILDLSGLALTADEQFDIIEEMVETFAQHHGVDAETIWEDFESVDDHELLESAAWHRKAGKNKNGGLNKKGVASYRREHPGSHLQTAVTTKPSKLKPGSKAAKRRKSFCARMGGSKGPMKKPNGEPTRKALALRKWHC